MATAPLSTTWYELALFLRQYGFGATLADDMGLGKTIQLITYLLKVKEAENTGPCVNHLSDIGSW